MPNPTDAQILEIRPDLGDYIPDELTLQDYSERALKYIKRDLEDIRGIEWGMVYDDDVLVLDYFTARNQDRIQHLISLRVASLIFHDYAVRASEDGEWWQLGNEYLTQYNELMERAKLDVDRDEDGIIDPDSDEEGQNARKFLSL